MTEEIASARDPALHCPRHALRDISYIDPVQLGIEVLPPAALAEIEQHPRRRRPSIVAGTHGQRGVDHHDWGAGLPSAKRVPFRQELGPAVRANHVAEA